MSEQIPVNPVMLRWARETGSFGIDDVVVKFKRKRITSETVSSWEKGESSPTYVQMERPVQNNSKNNSPSGRNSGKVLENKIEIKRRGAAGDLFVGSAYLTEVLRIFCFISY